MWSTTQCFGPLVSLWTMRFKGKHHFFERVIHDTYKFQECHEKSAHHGVSFQRAYRHPAHTSTAHKPQVSPLSKFPHSLKWQNAQNLTPKVMQHQQTPYNTALYRVATGGHGCQQTGM